jgi:hypothetical protein
VSDLQTREETIKFYDDEKYLCFATYGPRFNLIMAVSDAVVAE